MSQLVPFVELAQNFLFVPAPHAGGDNPRDAALCPHGIPEVIAAIGAVGKYLSRIVRQCVGACSAIVDIGRRDRQFLDQGRIGICPDRGFEAVNRPLSFVFDPARIVIAFAGRGDDGRIDQRIP